MAGDESRTFLARVRRAVFGRDTATAARVSSALREAARRSPGYLQADPGPFDEPPDEPVELDDAHLSWELRADPDDGDPTPTTDSRP